MTVNGWHLPSKDSYFSRFVEGIPRKRNGFQKEHLEEAFKLVDHFGVAIDVGAHVGFWTRDMAERFERVYAFEPAPDCYECLCLNMAEHLNVTVTNAAVGSVTGLCDMAEDPHPKRQGNTGARFVQPGRSTTMLRLDDLEFDNCDLLKIDVEGFEPAVIAGAKGLIRTFQPVIIMECDKRFPGRYPAFSKFEGAIAVLELGYKEIRFPNPDPLARGPKRNLLHPDRIFVPDV
jgi:FkbM family methyltransferase